MADFVVELLQNAKASFEIIEGLDSTYVRCWQNLTSGALPYKIEIMLLTKDTSLHKGPQALIQAQARFTALYRPHRAVVEYLMQVVNPKFLEDSVGLGYVKV